MSDETFLVFDITPLCVWILDKTFLLVSDIPEHPGLFLVHSLDYVIIGRTQLLWTLRRFTVLAVELPVTDGPLIQTPLLFPKTPNLQSMPL